LAGIREEITNSYRARHVPDPLVNDPRRKTAGMNVDPESLRYLVAARKQIRAATQDTTAVTTTDNLHHRVPSYPLTGEFHITGGCHSRTFVVKVR